MKKYYISLIIKISLIALMILIDILSKVYFENYFTSGNDSITLIDGMLGLTYIKNTGAAFGILGGNTILLLVFTILFLLVFVFVDFHYKSSNGWYIAGFSLMVGGAIGNMIDRLFLGYVRDFIELRFIDFPIFNFADIFLTVGVICYMVYLLFYEFRNNDKPKDITEDEE